MRACAIWMLNKNVQIVLGVDQNFILYDSSFLKILHLLECLLLVIQLEYPLRFFRIQSQSSQD